MRAQDLRSWVDSQRAAQDREREELRDAGADAAAAIRSALALVAIAAHLHGWPCPEDEVSLREGAALRERWDRVRAAFPKR